MPKRYYKRTYKRKKPIKYSKTKRLVTGRGPTMIEKIASGVGSAARLATAVAPIVAAINTEMKYTDTSTILNAYNPGTNDSIQLLSGISQGTGDSQRIGNSVLAKDISIKIFAAWLANSTNTSNICRVTLFVWKENAASNPPTAAKLFEGPASIFSAFNKDYTDQFVVLKDKIIVAETNFIPTGSTSASPRFFKYYKKLDFHMRWLDATTGVTQNHVYICVRGGGATSANQTSVTVYSRINYTDN